MRDWSNERLAEEAEKARVDADSGEPAELTKLAEIEAEVIYRQDLRVVDEVMDMTVRWACLDCSTTFPVGKVFMADRLRCPHCRSDRIQEADGKIYDVPGYVGEIGTRN